MKKMTNEEASSGASIAIASSICISIGVGLEYGASIALISLPFIFLGFCIILGFIYALGNMDEKD